MFKDVVKVYGLQHTDEELVRDYQAGFHNEVIAYVFEKNKNLFYQVSKKYVGVSEDEVTSIILEQIWKCFENFDAEKSTSGKLTSMICVYIKNALRTLTQSNASNKRKANNGDQCTPMSCYETTEDRWEEASVEDEYDKVELSDLVHKEDLSEKQLQYCMVALDHMCDLQQSHMAREIGVSTAGVVGIRRALQKKLNYLLS